MKPLTEIFSELDINYSKSEYVLTLIGFYF